MKVLFAVSSESISDAIIKRYQKEYKEILSYKNVYYFNAILKEIQKDKTYDRIVISEDLEPFSNNNYDTIDKFIFEKLDNISDEAQDSQGKETSIILICTDRHTKGSSFLVKLFGIGVYNALLGNDRSMEQVCRLINQPRLKKEAKMYYKIDADSVSYDSSNEKEVSELEIQNILNHFKKIAKNKEKFSDSFNNIASQYTDDQLKIIVNCLPISVKAVLEEECPKYQELMSASMIQRIGGRASLQVKEDEQQTGIKIDILESKLSQPKMSGPIVIPSSVKKTGVKAPTIVRRVDSDGDSSEQHNQKKIIKRIENNKTVEQIVKNDTEFDSLLSDIDDIEDINDNKSTANINNKILEEDDFSMTIDDNKDFDDSLIMSLDEEVEDDTSDDLLMSLDEEDEDNTSDDLLMSLDEEDEDNTSDDLLMSLDEEVEDDTSDDLLMSLDEETEDDSEDDLLMSLDEETEDDSEDDLLMSLDEETEDDSEDDLLTSLDEENEDDSVDNLLMSLDEENEEDTVDNLLNSLDSSNEVEENNIETIESKTITIKRGRGRPRKNPINREPKPKGKRGRPRKNTVEEDVDQENDDELLDLVVETEDDNDDLDLVLSTEEVQNSSLEEYVEANEDDDELLSILDDDFEDSSLEIVEEETNDFENISSNNVVIEEDEFSDEVFLPEIDELDDYEDDNDDILSGMDYEDLDEENYLVSANSNSEEQEDDLLTLTLEDDNSAEDVMDISINNEVQDDENDDELLSITDNFLEDETSIQSVKKENLTNQNYNQPAYNQSFVESNSNRIESIKPQVDYSMSTLNSLLTKDKKIVTFLGTTKNGTSFLINNLAALFSSLGINTAILDMTQNRNSYYIYTKNEEELRKIAYTSIEKLETGFAEGIKVDKNLTVYTALPNNGKSYTNAEPILSTLIQNHSLILIDCDFNTDPSYFASCQEIYLVQSMDILTIQPLTMFLRDLKSKGVLESEKVRVVINKELKVRSLTTKMIIGGMSFYNDPAMSFMTELFNKDMVKACSIPFEDITYSKYLDAMVNCSVSLNGYSKAFLSKLRILGDMVYPLTSKQTYSKQTQNYNKNAFSSSMNNTLNQMKNKF